MLVLSIAYTFHFPPTFNGIIADLRLVKACLNMPASGECKGAQHQGELLLGHSNLTLCLAVSSLSVYVRIWRTYRQPNFKVKSWSFKKIYPFLQSVSKATLSLPSRALSSQHQGTCLPVVCHAIQPAFYRPPVYRHLASLSNLFSALLVGLASTQQWFGHYVPNYEEFVWNAPFMLP